MYFDPDWIFENKPEKNQYPNITGLMGDKPKKPKKQKAEPLTSLADVFKRPAVPPKGSTELPGTWEKDTYGKWMYTATPDEIAKRGNEDAYQQWFSKEYPKSGVSFARYMQEPKIEGFPINESMTYPNFTIPVDDIYYNVDPNKNKVKVKEANLEYKDGFTYPTKKIIDPDSGAEVEVIDAPPQFVMNEYELDSIPPNVKNKLVPQVDEMKKSAQYNAAINALKWNPVPEGFEPDAKMVSFIEDLKARKENGENLDGFDDIKKYLLSGMDKEDDLNKKYSALKNMPYNPTEMATFLAKKYGFYNF